MTVTALVTRNDITATASQTSFTYTFRVLAATDMDVYQNGVLLSSGYTVNNVGNTTGGTVTLDSGVPVGQIVSLVLAMPLDRTTNYQNSGKFLADDVNEDFDKIYIGAVQNENEGGRSLRLKDVEPPTSGVDMTIPLKDDRKGKLLSFNSITGAPEASTLSVLYDSAAYTPYNFTGDGSTVAFTLGSTPNSENNTQVYIDGIYQQKDGYNVSGTVLTFSVAPPNLSTIEVMVTSALAVGATSSDLVSYTPAGTGAVATTVQAKLRESVSVKDFGAVGDGVTDDTAAIQAALNVGGVINFDGTNKVYLCKELIISNANMILNLQENTIKVHPSITASNDLISIQANNVCIRYGTLDGNSEANGRHLIDVEGDYACLENLTLIDATSDAIWIPEFRTYGYGDYLVVRDVTITNPGRHGVLYSWDSVNYRNSSVFDNITLTKSANTNWGLSFIGINNATITGIKALDGFAEKITLGRMNKVEVQGYFVADDSLTADLIDSVFVDNVFIRDSYFAGRLAGTGYNPSNTSDRVTVTNCRFDDCRGGVAAFENFDDITVTGCQFYRCDTALSIVNSSAAIITNNYFEDCKRTVSAATSTVDGKINYDDLVFIYNGNIVNRSGVEAIQLANTVGSFNVVEITNNLFHNIHNVTSAFPAYGSYSPTTDVTTFLISSSNSAIPVLNISSNRFIQDTAYASGVAGGGATNIMSLTNSVDLLRLRENFISNNYNTPIFMNADITELDVDTYIDSTEIDLSGGAVSFTGAPAMTAGNYLGLRLIYQEATSADAGIDVVLRDSVTGTVKGTITTSTSAAAGDSSFTPAKGLQMAKGRGPQIYTAGGKTGNGTCFARAYYLMLQQ